MSKITQRPYLFALLVSAVGDRPLGLQASQVAAAARWAKRRHPADPLTLVALGPRASLFSLVAGALETRAVDLPSFALGKGLSQKSEVGERSHRGHALLGQLPAGRIEIELAFQMMHSSLQKRLAVQAAPEADGAKFIAGRESFVGKVSGDFLG